MADDTMFTEAVAAARAGEVVRARDLLARLLRADSANPDYWLWMSAVVDSERESVYCLRSATKLRPNYPLAKLGLGVMGQVSLGAEREGPAKQHRSTPMPHQSAGRINSMGEWWKVRRNRDNAAITLLGMAAVVVIVAIVILRISTARIPLLAVSPPTEAAVLSPSPGPSQGLTYQPVPTLKNTVNPSNLIPFPTFVGVSYTPTPMYGISPNPPTGALAEAITAMNEGRYDDALAALDKLLRIEPKSAQAHYLKGEVYRAKKKWTDALYEYDLANQIDPNYAMAYYGRAMCRKDTNPDNDYDDDLTKALKLDPQFVDAYIMRAEFYSRRNMWKEALQDLERAVQIAPENAFALIRLGRAQIRNNKSDLALDNIIHAQLVDQTILEGYLALGEAYDALKFYSQAVTPLVVYATYNPEDILGWLRLGEAYTGTAQYSEALEACTKAVDINVNSVQARLCRGQVYRRIGEYKNAVNDLVIASNAAPNLYSTQFPYGCALLEYGRTDLAIKTLTRAKELASTVVEKADAMGWLALAYEKYNNFSKAQDIWKQLMELEGVPDYWKTTAYEHYFGLKTPTPGGETTATPAPSPTPTPTPTP
jgi:tetratricopeptide (TPR) repeat protein